MKIHLPLIALMLSCTIYAQQKITITHFDIGQGDATLITSQVFSDSVITVLFDAGGYTSLSGEDAGAIINEVLIDQGIRRIDYLVVSHYDADHIGGIVNEGFRNLYQTSFMIGRDNTPNTADDVRVIKVVDRGSERQPTSTIYQRYRDFTKTVQRDSIDTRHKLGYEIRLGPEAIMTCLAANGYVIGRDQQVKYANTENERSLSFLLRYRGFDYLISGDLIGQAAGAENARIEEVVGALIKRRSYKVDVYHADHHGANNGSEANFLNDIQAEVAIVSCGDNNSHDHPTLGALDRMVASGVDLIFQTNRGNPSETLPAFIKERQKVFNGHVVVATDGQSYQVYKYGYANLSGYYYEFNCDE